MLILIFYIKNVSFEMWILLSIQLLKKYYIPNFIKIITKIKYVKNIKIIIRIVIRNNIKINFLVLCIYISIFIWFCCVIVGENKVIDRWCK